MSLDPAINAALLNMCAQVQDSGNNNTSAAPSTTLALGPPSTAPSASPAASARPVEDYAWLRGALAAVESPEKRVKQLLFQMENKAVDGSGAGAMEPEERLEALEELSDMVEDVNWAAEFTLMQGPGRVLQVLRNECAAHPLSDSSSGETLSLLTQLSMIVAHSAQLNEPVQAVYQSEHWEAVVLPLVCDTVRAVQEVHSNSKSSGSGQATEEEETAVEAAHAAVSAATKLMKLLAAVLHACSCLCRESPTNTIQFIQQGGLAVLAEVLKLTHAVAAGEAALDAFPGAALPPVITTTTSAIQAETSNQSAAPSEEVLATQTEVDCAPLIAAANKVTTRVLFLSAYLASTGVSSEDIISLACQHAEDSDDATVQKACARLLLELVAKSPKAVKDAVHAAMPRRFFEWRRQLQHTVDDAEGAAAEGKDERQLFVEALDASN